MVSLGLIVLMTLVLGGCGVRNNPAIDTSKMQFSTSSPTAATAPGVPITDESQIKEALGNSFDSVVISANDGTYAAGSGMVKGNSSPQMWYALKEKGGWQIVWQGSGTIVCKDLVTYSDYPRRLIPECVNEAGKTVKR